MKRRSFFGSILAGLAGLLTLHTRTTEPPTERCGLDFSHRSYSPATVVISFVEDLEGRRFLFVNNYRFVDVPEVVHIEPNGVVWWETPPGQESTWVIAP